MLAGASPACKILALSACPTLHGLCFENGSHREGIACTGPAGLEQLPLTATFAWTLSPSNSVVSEGAKGQGAGAAGVESLFAPSLVSSLPGHSGPAGPASKAGLPVCRPTAALLLTPFSPFAPHLRRRSPPPTGPPQPHCSVQRSSWRSRDAVQLCGLLHF